MIIINLCGGLGNQMFQYSFGKYLSILLNQDVFLNIEIYEKGLSNRTFDLDIFRLSNCKIGGVKDIYDALGEKKDKIIIIAERFFQFDKAITNKLKAYALSKPGKDDVHVIISGYWQSEKYFSPIKKIIRDDFHLCNSLPTKWEVLQKKIISTLSIMINVRRGDYLNHLDIHGVVSTNYLKKSINYFLTEFNAPFFYIFSDDIKWCKDNLKDVKNVQFVDESYYDKKFQYYFALMMSCKHFIISNSTFCWWAAWLSRSKNKIIIAPKKWFAKNYINTKDLIPESWIRF